jgi:Putative DNA-binding domain
MAVQRRTKSTSDRDLAVAAVREGKTVDFKSQFDPASEAECTEFVKDLVAMANSGGGFILIGVQDDAELSGADISSVLRLGLIGELWVALLNVSLLAFESVNGLNVICCNQAFYSALMHRGRLQRGAARCVSR